MDIEFRYEAMTLDGAKSSGTISAADESQARDSLQAKGLAVLKLQRVASSGASGSFALSKFFQKKPQTKEVILFTKQFRTLYVSGISVTEIFKTLAAQSENAVMRRALLDIDKRVTEGSSLRQAFEANKHIFSSLYCSMIAAGETSGSMSDVVDRLTYIMDHEQRVQDKIKSATRYPKIVLAVMAVAFLVLLNFVIPQFAGVFSKAKVELPLPTQIAIELNHLFNDYWWVVLPIVIAIVVGSKMFFKTAKGMVLWDSFMLRVPLVGNVIKKAIIARFASIFGILQRSGISIIETFGILQLTIDNAFFASQFNDVVKRIQSGDSIASSLAPVKGFSALAISLIAVGERSGHIDTMMEELAKHYDAEVEYSVEQMTEYIGPVLIMCLGVVLLFFALAIFMPMWDMVKFVG